MNPFALIPFCSFVTCTLLCAIVFFYNPRARLNRLYTLLSASLAICAFIEFGYRQSRGFDEACFWWKIDVFWPFNVALTIHFVLLFTERFLYLRKHIAKIFLYGPVVVLILLELTTDKITARPEQQYWGWTYGTPEQNWIYLFASIWILGGLTFSSISAIGYHLRATGSRPRRQTRVFAVAMSLSTVLVFSEFAIRYFGFKIPPLTVGAFCLQSLVLAYAVWRHELFSLTPITAAETIVTTMPDALILINLRGEIESYNTSAAELLGVTQKALVKTPVDRLFAAHAKRPTWLNSLGHCELQQRVEHTETQFNKGRAGEVSVSLSSTLLCDDKGDRLGFLMIARDIGEQIAKERELIELRERLELLANQRRQELDASIEDLRRTQAQLKRLDRHLTQAKEQESARISRELQNGLGQILSGMKIDSLMLAKKFRARQGANSDAYAERFEGTAELVDTAIHAVKNIAKDLRPVMLDEIGLVATIEWMIRRYERRTGINCLLDSDVKTERFAPELSTAVYRIVQESLTNVARHADAKRVAVRMREPDGKLVVDIEDDGVGIESADIRSLNALGILGMSERAQAFGGQVEIRGSPGAGTEVKLCIPTGGRQ